MFKIILLLALGMNFKTKISHNKKSQNCNITEVVIARARCPYKDNPPCPMDCRFGIMKVPPANATDCATCVCRPHPCDSTKCPKGTKCQLVNDKPCIYCAVDETVHCVPVVVPKVSECEYKDDPPCPMDCRFGIMKVPPANATDCASCVCRPHPCDSTKCPVGQECQLVNDNSCMFCAVDETVHCVPSVVSKVSECEYKDDPPCPMDCRFGIMKVPPANATDCATCVCRPHPCDSTKCPVGTECQLVNDKPCMFCAVDETVHCVPTVQPKVSECQYKDNPPCPVDCKFGIMKVPPANATDCATCVCRPHPCDSKKCPTGTECRLVKDNSKNCRFCAVDETVHCVPIKSGDCPIVNFADQKRTKVCELDSECPGIEKCCGQKCSKPCPNMLCKCSANFELKTRLNQNGCRVCDCEPHDSHDVCSAPMVVGICKASFHRFYYDNVSKKCKKFIYGGCGGNKNNFEKLEDCVNKCQRTVKTNVTKENVKPTKVINESCLLPAVTGMCRASFEMYYYDSLNGTCNKFIYGGCGGNANRFESKEKCLSSCELTESQIDSEDDGCLKPSFKTKCHNNNKGRYFYDARTKKCKRIPKKFCTNSKNAYKSIAECENKCVSRVNVTNSQNPKCLLKAEPGPCYAFIPRYFHNATTGQCEEFIYGGCKGNDNNFENENDCEKACLSNSNSTEQALDKNPNVCSLPVNAGPCYGSFPRYFHNVTSGQCEEFIYGGCQGNLNNFENADDCERICENRDNLVNEKKCSLKADSGPCYASLIRYFHNSTSGQCEEFIYGGCQGNENNFNNLDDCEKSCLKSDSEDEEEDSKHEVKDAICSLPKVVGRCRALLKRYYYNSQNDTCQEFNYGGCDGNANNFENLQACRAACKPKVVVEKVKNAVCKLPKLSGPCLAAIRRFYYDSQSDKCLEFRYGGCKGNGNNFENLQECQKQCAN